MGIEAGAEIDPGGRILCALYTLGRTRGASPVCDAQAGGFLLVTISAQIRNASDTLGGIVVHVYPLSAWHDFMKSITASNAGFFSGTTGENTTPEMGQTVRIPLSEQQSSARHTSSEYRPPIPFPTSSLTIFPN